MNLPVIKNILYSDEFKIFGLVSSIVISILLCFTFMSGFSEPSSYVNDCLKPKTSRLLKVTGLIHVYNLGCYLGEEV
jgi:hypothetical protein